MNKTPLFAIAMVASAGSVFAQQVDSVVRMSEVTVHSQKVANQDPSGTFAMPVSALRFDPLVDVQARNLAEGQADISIRGGIFENTGFKVGALSLYDPQTGHYVAEVPIAPSMLGSPSVLTGSDNALNGFNASVGTISYGLRPITTVGTLALAAGEYDSNREEIYQGYSKVLAPDLKLGADFAFAHSASDGSVPFGDHRFYRYDGRFQLQSAAGQTDLLAAYQSKFFGWPNLYTPFGYNESEDLQTVLFLLNHRKDYGDGEYLQAGAFWRRNKDDYEFNRAVPGASNPYQHTTWAYGSSIEGRSKLSGEGLSVNYSGSVMFDALESTSLVYGPFRHRDYYKASFVPEKDWKLEAGKDLVLKAGGSFDDTNKGASAFSPLLDLSLLTKEPGKGLSRIYFDYSKSTQVATYTALKSSSTAGLFRGNPDLGRSASHNLELGDDCNVGDWKAHAAIFWRYDKDLVDWTYRRGVTARSANAVDIATSGLELTLGRSWSCFDMTLGYTAMSKDADYGQASVDSSFYALNYAKHRLTAAFVAKLGHGFEIRMDNEARLQEDNYLRRSTDRALISAVAISYRPQYLSSLVISAQLDNLWNSDFEEVPGTPAGRRQFTMASCFSW
jgi:hypothetical protein